MTKEPSEQPPQSDQPTGDMPAESHAERVSPEARTAPPDQAGPPTEAEKGRAPMDKQAFHTPSADASRLMKNIQPKLIRTILDPEAVRKMGERLTEEREFRVREKIKSAPPAKQLESITNFKKATACPASREPADSKERVSFCQKCKLLVYNFKDIEPPEAEELIFKRENRRNAVLYKRADGRFLTQDCPVGVSQTQQKMFLIAGSCLLVVTLLVLFLLVPHPSPPPSPTLTTDSQPTQTNPSSADALKSAPASSTPGNANATGTPDVMTAPAEKYDDEQIQRMFSGGGSIAPNSQNAQSTQVPPASSPGAPAQAQPAAAPSSPAQAPAAAPASTTTASPNNTGTEQAPPGAGGEQSPAPAGTNSSPN